MNRTGLIVALVIAVIAGLVFGFYPELDLRIAKYFHDFIDKSRIAFSWRISPPLMRARDIGLWITTLLVLPAVVALVVKALLPKRKLFMPARAIVFLIVTLALGPGLLVNGLLKDHWGRPRPIDVSEFDGKRHFVPWWDPRGDCPNNCSFVSGDVSGAFWTIAPAALAPPQWRALAYGAALTFGTVMATFRVMAGGHFVSDTIFAGVFTFLIIWIVHGLLYRWWMHPSDESIERAIERLAMPGYKLMVSILGIFGGKKKPES